MGTSSSTRYKSPDYDTSDTSPATWLFYVILPGSVTFEQNGEPSIVFYPKLSDSEYEVYPFEREQSTLADLVKYAENKYSIKLYSTCLNKGQRYEADKKLDELRHALVYLFLDNKSKIAVLGKRANTRKQWSLNRFYAGEETVPEAVPEVSGSFKLPPVEPYEIANMGSCEFKTCARQYSRRLILYSIVHRTEYEKNFQYIIDAFNSDSTFSLKEKRLCVGLVTLLALIRHGVEKTTSMWDIINISGYMTCEKDLLKSFLEISEKKVTPENFKAEFAEAVDKYFLGPSDKDRDCCFGDCCRPTEYSDDEEKLRILKIIDIILSQKLDMTTAGDSLELSNVIHSVKILTILTLLSPLAVPYTILLFLMFTILAACPPTIKYWLYRKLFLSFNLYAIASASLAVMYIPFYNLFLYHYYNENNSIYEVNVLEAYWPLVLILYTFIVILIPLVSGLATFIVMNRDSKVFMQAYEKTKTMILSFNANVFSDSKNDYIAKLPSSQASESNSVFWNSLFCLCCEKKSICEETVSLLPHIQLQHDRSHGELLKNFFKNHYVVGIPAVLSFFALVLIHPCIPYFYRHSNFNSTKTAERPWYVKSIEFSYIYVSLIFYTLFIIMIIRSLVYYSVLLHKLSKLMTIFTLKIDLMNPVALEYVIYVLKLSQATVNTDKRFLLTMAFALLVDGVLVITSLIRLLLLHDFGLLTAWSLIDIIILSLFILLFLLIAVRINKILMSDFTQLLINLRMKAATEQLVRPDALPTNGQFTPGRITTTTTEGTLSLDTLKQLKVTPEYLNSVIDHLQNSKEDYAIKLFGLVIDQAMLIKVVGYMGSGIVSSAVSFSKSR